MLKVLDLFSGIGGFSLGLERTGGFKTVAFCEIDPFCRKVLAKHWPDVPIYEDVKELRHDGPVDVICGGYPCQPFSQAGKQKGEEDDRHLWPAMFEVIKAHRPAWVIGENVAGHISMGLDQVLSDLEGEGYTARPYVIPASGLDAPHRRDRIWIVAHAEPAGAGYKPRTIGDERRRTTGTGSAAVRQGNGPSVPGRPDAASKDVADAAKSRRQSGQDGEACQIRNEARLREPERRCSGQRAAEWLPEPDVGRVANGVPMRVDRLRSLGNAVVPQIPEQIGLAILEAERLK